MKELKQMAAEVLEQLQSMKCAKNSGFEHDIESTNKAINCLKDETERAIAGGNFAKVAMLADYVSDENTKLKRLKNVMKTMETMETIITNIEDHIESGIISDDLRTVDVQALNWVLIVTKEISLLGRVTALQMGELETYRGRVVRSNYLNGLHG